VPNERRTLQVEGVEQTARDSGHDLGVTTCREGNGFTQALTRAVDEQTAVANQLADKRTPGRSGHHRSRDEHDRGAAPDLDHSQPTRRISQLDEALERLKIVEVPERILCLPVPVDTRRLANHRERLVAHGSCPPAVKGHDRSHRALDEEV
jgi:hypothetical protein